MKVSFSDPQSGSPLFNLYFLPENDEERNLLAVLRERMWLFHGKPETETFYIPLDNLVKSDYKNGVGLTALVAEVFRISREKVIPNPNMRDVLQQVLATLTIREKKILELRFGLDTPPMTWKRMGNVFSVSPGRTRQIAMKALRRLRHPERIVHLHQFVPESEQ
jgi:DNA-directed RNA polymerase sigma subunit (sigma70/sigma32)